MALSNIMQKTLIKQLIADNFDEVVLIETATGRVLNILGKRAPKFKPIFINFVANLAAKFFVVLF